MMAVNILMWVFLALFVGLLLLLCVCRAMLARTRRGEGNRAPLAGLDRTVLFVNNVLGSFMEGRPDFSGRRRRRGGDGSSSDHVLSRTQMHAVLLRLALSHRQGDFTAQDYEMLQRLDDLETGGNSDSDSDGSGSDEEESGEEQDIEQGGGSVNQMGASGDAPAVQTERLLGRGLRGRRGRHGASRDVIRSLPRVKFHKPDNSSSSSSSCSNGAHSPLSAAGANETVKGASADAAGATASVNADGSNNNNDNNSSSRGNSADTASTSGTAVGVESERCSICLSVFEEGECLRVLPCLHRYHMQCVDRWLYKQSSACPICKERI